MTTESPVEQYMAKFQNRISKHIALLDFVDQLEVEETRNILRELTSHPENMPLIKHEALAYLTSAFVLKCSGVPMRKKSWLERLKGIFRGG